MARPERRRCGGIVFHVFNRAARRLTLFERDSDYAVLEQVLAEASERTRMRLLCLALMPNHIHLVLWPVADGDLSKYMHWVTTTHSLRWHMSRGTRGLGAVYQGRFKAIPVRTDEHFLALCCYVERNAVRAGLVATAEDWKWSSASRFERESDLRLDQWPVPRPGDWSERLNRPQEATTERTIRRAVRFDVPYGPPDWVRQTAATLGWTSRLRGRGRPAGDRSGLKTNGDAAQFHLLGL